MEVPFFQVLADQLGAGFFKNRKVVDVGCARFAETKQMQQLGASMMGLDICKREEPPEGIDFILSDFLTWEPTEPTDVLYLSNCVLFMPTSDVMQKIDQLSPNVIAIRTMYDYPEPNWPAEELKQLYFSLPEDWSTFFEAKGYKTVFTRKYAIDTPDMRNRMRNFRFTEYIGVKF